MLRLNQSLLVSEPTCCAREAVSMGHVATKLRAQFVSRASVLRCWHACKSILVCVLCNLHALTCSHTHATSYYTACIHIYTCTRVHNTYIHARIYQHKYSHVHTYRFVSFGQPQRRSTFDQAITGSLSLVKHKMAQAARNSSRCSAARRFNTRAHSSMMDRAL